MNTSTLGGYPIYDPPRDFNRVTNCMEMHTGASRYGVGKFLMLASDYRAMISDASDAKGVVELILKSDQGDGIDFNVQVAAAAPLSTATAQPNSSSANDVVEVTVYDLRCKLYAPVTKSYNCTKPNFKDYYASTLTGGSPWAWRDVIDDVASVTNLATMPSWTPQNLIFDGVPTVRVVDDVAARLFLVASARDTSISLNNPGYISSANNTLLTKAAPYLIGGGDTERNPARIPGVVRVTFKVYDADNEDDPFVNRAYTKDVTTTLAGADSSYIQALHCGERVAVYSGGSFTNSSDLDTVAADMAARATAFMAVDIKEQKYAGIWPFFPDGAIRGVRWVSDADGAYTVIRFNHDCDFDVMPRRFNELVSNQLVVGLAGTNTSVTASGQRRVWAHNPLQIVSFIVNFAISEGVYDGAYTSAATAQPDSIGGASPDYVGAEGHYLTGTSCMVIDCFACQFDNGFSGPQFGNTGCNLMQQNAPLMGFLWGDMSDETPPRPIVRVFPYFQNAGVVGRPDGSLLVTPTSQYLVTATNVEDQYRQSTPVPRRGGIGVLTEPTDPLTVEPGVMMVVGGIPYETGSVALGIGSGSFDTLSQTKTLVLSLVGGQTLVIDPDGRVISGTL